MWNFWIFAQSDKNITKWHSEFYAQSLHSQWPVVENCTHSRQNKPLLWAAANGAKFFAYCTASDCPHVPRSTYSINRNRCSLNSRELLCWRSCSRFVSAHLTSAAAAAQYKLQSRHITGTRIKHSRSANLIRPSGIVLTVTAKHNLRNNAHWHTDIEFITHLRLGRRIAG